MIYTIRNQKLDPLNIDPKLVNAWDIAWGLQHQNRYLGHTKVPWSVLSHLGLICQIFMMVNKEPDPKKLLQLMLHDAGEAYLGDIIRPLKNLPEFAFYKEAEERALRVIYPLFGAGEYDEVDWAEIEKYDLHALYVEYHKLGRGPYDDPTRIPQPQFGEIMPPGPLTMGKAKDFVPWLKDLALQCGCTNANQLFEFPESLSPYLEGVGSQPENAGSILDQDDLLSRGV